MKTKEEILKNLDTDNQSFVNDNLIFLTLTGSRAYGTDTPDSDYDYKGICIPTIDYYLGLKKFDQREDKSNDITIYSVTRFFQLASEVNPNIVELLFVDPNTIVYQHPIMQRIIDNRELFLSKKAKHTFSGYAFSQLKKIKGHKRWLDSPIIKPDREKLGLPKMPKFGKEKLKALVTLGDELLVDMCGEEWLDYFRSEKEYYAQQQEYERYKHWQDNRNTSRAELEKKSGYDTKHASHLIRLIRMAKEIATEKTIHTYRPDREFLLDIRRGKFSYDEIVELAEEEEKELQELFDKSDLPYTVNHKKIGELHQSILEEFLYSESQKGEL